MKKTYIMPSAMVVNVKNTEILAGSPNLSADPTQTSTGMDAKYDLGFYDEDDEEDDELGF